MKNLNNNSCYSLDQEDGGMVFDEPLRINTPSRHRRSARTLFDEPLHRLKNSRDKDNGGVSIRASEEEKLREIGDEQVPVSFPQSSNP